MRIVAAGASGFLGRSIVRFLRGRGDTVTTLVRRAPRMPGEVAWNPARGMVPDAPFDGADVVINLCGAGIGDRRWTTRRKVELRDSRLVPTQLLAQACAGHAVGTLLSASAVGFYGDRGDELLTESAPAGTGFLAQLCRDWEAATASADGAGCRVVHLRTGLVLGPDGGLLPRLSLLTRLLLGGRLGAGTQWWPWISIADYCAAVGFLASGALFGAVNMTAPHPVTNGQFTRELAAALHRPAPWVIPPLALRLALGGFADEILGGQRAIPAALTDVGFPFLHTDVATALQAFAR